MAEFVLSAVITKATEAAENLLLEEWSSLNSLEESMNWLQTEMKQIQSYIIDARTKLTEGDSRMKNLIKFIEQLADDANDILDEFVPKIERKGTVRCRVCHVSSAHKFVAEIEKIKKRVAEIDRLRTTYCITDTSNNNQQDYIPVDQRKLFLHADETEVIGLDDDFDKLQHKLLDHDLPYGVVSIVGMPGVGKTTLAKKLYRHVSDQFERSGLVYVSQQPRAGEILHDIAKQVGVTEYGRKDNLEGNLRSLLKEKRYVILLDDIWDVEIWNYLKLVLPEHDSKIGSRIIITSRNSNVGRYIGGDSSLHVLHPLDSEKSFELFTKKILIFDNNNWANASSDLVNIGRSIVGRCGGIPLAIVVTAGMLRARERTEHAWNRVLESMSQKIQDGCAKILTLSYNDLPIALRPCFLYFGLYPEDHEIRAFDLTNMWIAEKLIVVNSGNRRKAEDLAEDFLNDLVSRNLIQVARRTYDGRISSCRIHDLLHSLCVDLAEESNFFHTEHNAFGDPDNIARVRRITFYSDDNAMKKFFRLNPKPKKLHALFCFTKQGRIISQMAHLDFKLLQVLVVVLPQDSYVKIPNKFGSMSCLRYLRLEGEISGKLSNNIVKLKRLETVDIRKSSIRLPSGVWESKQLSHVCCRGFYDASHGCFSISPKMFTYNLQTLMWIKDEYFEPRLFQELRKLGILGVSDSTIKVLAESSPMLKSLEVVKLNFSKFPSEQINLSSNPNIVKLHVYAPFPSRPIYRIIHFKIEAFPPNLVKLTLFRFKVDVHLLAMLKKLPKLRIFKMIRCKYNEGKMDLSCNANGDSFPQLEVLHIQDPFSLSQISCRDNVSMPKLKKILLAVRVSEQLTFGLPERLANTIFKNLQV